MKETLKQYEELASTDTLTKVFNHGRIETEIRNAIEQYQKEKLPVSMMILDIDHFKSVNDRYGHAVGDTTLVHLAEVTNNALAGKNTALGRWGGEEFVAIIYGESEESLLADAEMLRSTIEQAQFEVVGSITCSIGVALLNSDDTSETWFKRADHAMYTAKSTGRNRVCYE